MATPKVSKRESLTSACFPGDGTDRSRGRGSEAACKRADRSDDQAWRTWRGAILEDQELLADAPAFERLAGESYLIFLTFDYQLDMFVISEFDVFNVNGPRARAAGTRTLETPYGKELEGRASKDAISAVSDALRR